MVSYMPYLLIIGGVYHLSFAIFHISIWWLKKFNWKEELPRMSLINRSGIQMLNVAVIIFLFLIAYVSFRYPEELLSSNLGKVLLFSTSFFWLARLIGELVFKDKNSINLPLLIFCVIGISLYLLPAII